MIIQTKFHGEQKINNEDIISFESGIPGFLDEKEFSLFSIEGTPLKAMQSIHTKEGAFIITEPFSFFTDYEFNLPDEIIESLKIHSEKDILVFVILTVQEPFDRTTANLQAPIIINQTNKQGKQVILNPTSYTTRHHLIQPLAVQQEGK